MSTPITATAAAAPATATSGSGNSKNATPTNPSGELGKDDFLKLMVAQLRSQDPMQPTDDSAYIGRPGPVHPARAGHQPGGVELETAASQEQAQAVALIGHKVSYIDPKSGLPQNGTVQTVQIGSTGTTLTIDGNAGVSPKNIKEVA